jgi:hypothetical protein
MLAQAVIKMVQQALHTYLKTHVLAHAQSKVTLKHLNKLAPLATFLVEVVTTVTNA